MRAKKKKRERKKTSPALSQTTPLTGEGKKTKPSKDNTGRKKCPKEKEEGSVKMMGRSRMLRWGKNALCDNNREKIQRERQEGDWTKKGEEREHGQTRKFTTTLTDNHANSRRKTVVAIGNRKATVPGTPDRGNIQNLERKEFDTWDLPHPIVRKEWPKLCRKKGLTSCT